MTLVRNNTHALIHGLKTISENGSITDSRFGVTKEVLNYHITIQRPLEKMIHLRGLDVNIPAQIIGGWWILSGSNDISVLEQYLPQAQHRSDDDVTWRGGFGPRLRNWHGVDQIKEVLKIINSRPESRRASIALFDPQFDFHQSKDVSTTNTIHFIVRDGKLHMSVDMRSADILGHSVPGGLATNNLYEWSLLLEVMSFWSGYAAGNLHVYVHSLHLYEQDFQRGASIIELFDGESIYEQKPLTKHSFSTSFDDFDATLEEFFATEQRLPSTNLEDLQSLGDPLLDSNLQYLWHFFHEQHPLHPRLQLSDLASPV